MKRSNAMKTLLDICKAADSQSTDRATTKLMRFNALLEAIKSNAYDMVKLPDKQKEMGEAIDNLTGSNIAYQVARNKGLMNLPSIEKLSTEYAKQYNKSYLELIISLVKDPPEALTNAAKSDDNSSDRAVLNAIPQFLRTSTISEELITALDEKNSSPAKVEEALKNIKNIPPEQLKAIHSWIFESKQAECKYRHACVEKYLNSDIPQEERQELESLFKAEKAFNEFIYDYVEGKDMGRYTKTFTMSRTSDKILLALSGVITAAAIAPAMGGGVALATEINNISGVLTAFETLAATNPALLAGIVLASTLGLAAVVMGLLSVGTKSALNEITDADAKPLYAALEEQVREVVSPTVEKA